MVIRSSPLCASPVPSGYGSGERATGRLVPITRRGGCRMTPHFWCWPTTD